MTKPFEAPIYVTRPYLPPIEEFCADLQEIWNGAQLTNNGPVLRRFQAALSEYCGTRNICLFNNGMLALQIGLQGLRLSGEVITTPFTFVATSHALYWNKLRPVFVDIEPEHYTLDPVKVEAAITPWTTAILAVHVYGYPCKLHALAEIARRHKIALIYDAAHSFGVTVNGNSIGNFGDLSMFSFHATKLFHSVEGGMLTFPDGGHRRIFEYLRNFGFESEVEVVMPGTNAKMNEFQALMGLQVLKQVDRLIEAREKIDTVYRAELKNVPGIHIPELPEPGVRSNHAYFPIEIHEDKFGQSRDQVYEALKCYNIFSRRYFYPLLTEFAPYKGLSLNDPLDVAKKVASRVLTLPIYDALKLEDVVHICDAIRAIRLGDKSAVLRS